MREYLALREGYEDQRTFRAGEVSEFHFVWHADLGAISSPSFQFNFNSLIVYCVMFASTLLVLCSRPVILCGTFYSRWPNYQRHVNGDLYWFRERTPYD
jgi:hypothetical protein